MPCGFAGTEKALETIHLGEITMSRNWTDIGLTWDESDVSERTGPNASSKFVLGEAQIPVLADTEKAIASGLGDAILAGVNGTSWRVSAQDVARSYLKANGKRDAHGRYILNPAQIDELRDRAFARVKGLRNPSIRTVTTVTVHNFPDGTQYTGSDEVVYRQEFASRLVDMGVPADTARAAAMTAKW